MLLAKICKLACKLNSNIKWTTIKIQEPILSENDHSYLRTYNIDVSMYNEIDISILINAFSGIDSRIIYLHENNNANYYYLYGKSEQGYEFFGDVHINKNNKSIVVATHKTSLNPTINYLVLSILKAR